MNDKIKKMINEAVLKIIEHTSSQAVIEHLQDKHNVKFILFRKGIEFPAVFCKA
ncbi:MAG: hypothetical protein LBU09_05745 [Endomicrobium sp.]|jgi:hypothetical protein|nr:hypothetical protein [Endomicrobium sp.]